MIPETNLFDHSRAIELPPVTALAPWYGAKRKMASTIIAEIGEHRAYWEPFCGSMAVLLAKHTRVIVSYYDHPALADLYPGWSVRACQQTKSLVSQGRRGKDNNTVAPEVLLINGRVR